MRDLDLAGHQIACLAGHRAKREVLDSAQDAMLGSIDYLMRASVNYCGAVCFRQAVLYLTSAIGDSDAGIALNRPRTSLLGASDRQQSHPTSLGVRVPKMLSNLHRI